MVYDTIRMKSDEGKYDEGALTTYGPYGPQNDATATDGRDKAKDKTKKWLFEKT